MQIAVIVTDSELEPLDEGIELIVRTEKDVLDRMNEWYVASGRRKEKAS